MHKYRTLNIYKSERFEEIDKNILLYSDIFKKYRYYMITELKYLKKIPLGSPIMRFGVISYFKHCLRTGGMVLLLFDGNSLIFRGCIQKGPYLINFLDRSFIKINNNDLYIELCETHPDYRGQKIYSSILASCRKMASRLNSNLYIATDETNSSSNKGIMNAGFILEKKVVIEQCLFSNKMITINLHPSQTLELTMSYIPYFIYIFKKYTYLFFNIFL